MSLIESVRPRSATVIPEPPIAKFLFADTRMAWFWLIVRLYVGYQFLTAGLEKVFGMDYTFGSTFNTAVQGGGWIFNRQVPLGTQMAGFANGAIAKATGEHPAVQGWYADFLKNVVVPNAGFWAFLISFGELAVGVGLIVGLLTGIAAFFGLFMNLNFLLAGAISSNPILGVLGLFLILAWRVAGYYGVDRWLLPLLGTPWTGQLAGKSDEEITQRTGTPPIPAMS